MQKILLSLLLVGLAAIFVGCKPNGGLEREFYEMKHGVYVMPDNRKLEYKEFISQEPPKGKVYQSHWTEKPRLFYVTIETDYCDPMYYE